MPVSKQSSQAGAVQANLSAVNDAVNNLLIEEEDFTSLRESISTYDAFDQIGLASRLEGHELLEFRRTAAAIYKNNQRWRKAIALAKQDHLYKVLACLSRKNKRKNGACVRLQLLQAADGLVVV